MKPLTSADLPDSPYMRWLILGGPKVGKTFTTIKTLQSVGGVYVINSDDKYSLQGARDDGNSFEWNFAPGTDVQQIQEVIAVARQGVKEGRFKVIVWDTITKYSRRVFQVFEDATRNAAGQSDGRRFWPLYHNHMHSIVDRLLSLDAHVIVNAHWIDIQSAVIDGQTEKVGAGIVPMLGGTSRQTIPADFQDVLFMQQNQKGEREFLTHIAGVWGPGGRSLAGSGITSYPADVSALWTKMREHSEKKRLMNNPEKKE